MKYIFSGVVLFISFFSLSSLTTFAITQCIGQPVTITWTSSNCPGNSPTISAGPGSCTYSNSAASQNGGPLIIGTTPSSGSCTVLISCSGATTGSDTINVDTSKEWDGSSCVTPVNGVCNNSIPHQCSAGTNPGSSPNGGGFGGWAWYCDGTPNTAAHRSPLCSWDPDGCRIATDPYYAPGGPNNNLACAGYCANGASNYTACTTFPAVDTCGGGSGATPQNPEPTGGSACSYGALTSNSPADTSSQWNWSCGALTSCSAPKYGCQLAYDSNYTLPQYGASGPNNNYGCASTCLNGGSNYPTCTPPVGVLSGTLSSSASTCTIALGASTCSTNLTWTTTNPVGTSAITKNNPAGTVFTANNGGPSAAASTGVGATTFYLYNNTVELASTTITSSCVSGGLDTTSGTCRDPLVVSMVATGQYYGPGSINFTCSGSNYYTLRNTNTNTIVSQGAYTTSLSIPIPSGPSANYGLICSYNTVDSPQRVEYYNTPPPPVPLSSISASSANINAKNTQVALNWTIQYPSNACTLTAIPVCANNVCTASQTAAASALNVVLGQNTDLNDPRGSRSIRTALTTVFPGDPNFKTYGKKTVTLNSSMDFTIDCGSGNKVNTRVRYTTSDEQ